MRITCLQVFLGAALLALAPGRTPATELEVRSGVVTLVQPTADETVQSQARVSRSTRRQLGGMFGRAAGQALGGGSGHAYEIGRAAGSVGADLAGNEGSRAAGGGYLLLIRFDDESEAAFTRGAEQVGGLRAGSRVKVIGSGEGARLLAE